MNRKTISALILALIMIFCSVPANAAAYDYNAVYGDVTEDGETGSKDALYVLQNCVKKVYFSEKLVKIGDVNCDGKLTVADALKILQYSVRKNTNSIKVMTYNVRYTDPDAIRKANVFQNIDDHDPDVFGLEEVTPTWTANLNKHFGDTYSSVSGGRNGGGGDECTPIFYKTEKYELLDSGIRWLSSTPLQISKIDESHLNRIFTYVLLRDIDEDFTFMYINTHLDDQSDVARLKQSQYLLDFVNERNSYPIIITGDFNSVPDESCYKNMTSSGFDDSAKIACQAYESFTYNGFSHSGTGWLLDYCFLSKGDFYVRKYSVIDTLFDGEFASDHFPVYAEINLIG